LPYMRILEFAIPAGLIVILICLLVNPKTYWAGRFATYFVDPNTLGSQTFILALLSLLMLRSPFKTNVNLNFFKLAGGFVGLYISLYSGSRGGWLAGPFIFLAWMILRFDDISELNVNKKTWRYIENIGIIFFVTTLFITAFFFLEPLSSRVSHGYLEIRNWVTGIDLNGSAGIRLSMWRLSLQMIGDHFWFGYGEIGMGDLLASSYLNTPQNQIAIANISVAGPHNDIFSKLLSLGFIGLLAYFILLLTPFFIFWINRRNKNFSKRYASRIGMFYIVGVVICGIANEQLSLKYLCSFYALMVATLLAQVLNKSGNLDGKQT